MLINKNINQQIVDDNFAVWSKRDVEAQWTKEDLVGMGDLPPIKFTNKADLKASNEDDRVNANNLPANPQDAHQRAMAAAQEKTTGSEGVKRVRESPGETKGEVPPQPTGLPLSPHLQAGAAAGSATPLAKPPVSKLVEIFEQASS